MIQLPCPEVYYGSHRFAPDSPPVPAGGLFLYGSDLSPRSSCFNDGYPSPQALIPGEPTRILIRLCWQSFLLLTCNRASLLTRWNCTLN